MSTPSPEKFVEDGERIEQLERVVLKLRTLIVLVGTANGRSLSDAMKYCTTLSVKWKAEQGAE